MTALTMAAAALMLCAVCRYEVRPQTLPIPVRKAQGGH
jgi:hypothetical protein